LWWTKWHWDRFFSELSVFPCRFNSTGAPLIVKIGKRKLLIFIIIGVAQKALKLWCEGPSSRKKKSILIAKTVYVLQMLPFPSNCAEDDFR
jgi:hypothetical protein